MIFGNRHNNLNRVPEGPYRINKNSPQAKGLVNWFPAAASAGSSLFRNLAGASGDSTHGDFTMVGNAAFSNASPGPAFNMAADGDYFTWSTKLDFPANTDLTMVIWGNFNFGAGSPGFWRSRDNGTGPDFFILQTTDRPWIRWNGNDGLKPSSGTLMKENTDVMIAYVVEDAGFVGWYQDGILEHSSTTTGQWATDSDIQQLGWQGGTTESIKGDYYEIRFYDRVVDANEMWAMYDPLTRWDLYEPVYKIWPAVAPVGEGPVVEGPYYVGEVNRLHTLGRGAREGVGRGT